MGGFAGTVSKVRGCRTEQNGNGGGSAVLAPLYDLPHPRHHLVMRDAGFCTCKRLLDLGAHPRVMGFGFLGRRELGYDGIEFGHGRRISAVRSSGNQWRVGSGPIWTRLALHRSFSCVWRQAIIVAANVKCVNKKGRHS